jgi:IclR family transcriptional regulator, acetate operon repressor
VETSDETRLVGADRVLVVLKELARHPAGAGLEDLTRAVNSPKPTVHRALVALRRAGFADQDARGHYVLGDEFLRLAFAHDEARPDHERIRPALERLAHRFGETVHYAVLEGREVVYRAKIDAPTGAVRLTSTVGGRNPAHTTGVGKLLLAFQIDGTAEAVRTWLDGSELERRTANTICAPDMLGRELQRTRDRGYAVDDQENELGINCLAVPVFLASPSVPSGAVSVSALAYRTPLTALVAGLEDMRLDLGILALGAS